MVEFGIFLGAVLVCIAALPHRSKRVPDNVIQLVPKQGPIKAEVRAAGQLIEFHPKTKESK